MVVAHLSKRFRASARPQPSPGILLLRRPLGDTKLKFSDLESWTTIELVALYRRAGEILKARVERDTARDKSLETLLKGGKEK